MVDKNQESVLILKFKFISNPTPNIYRHKYKGIYALRDFAIDLPNKLKELDETEGELLEFADKLYDTLKTGPLRVLNSAIVRCSGIYDDSSVTLSIPEMLLSAKQCREQLIAKEIDPDLINPDVFGDVDQLDYAQVKRIISFYLNDIRDKTDILIQQDQVIDLDLHDSLSDELGKKAYQALVADSVVKQDAEKTIIFDHAQICFGHALEDLLKH